MNLPMRPAKSASKAKAPRSAVQGAGDDADLYDQLFHEGLPQAEVAATWTKSFVDGPSLAMVEIVNFILRCAGCEESVTHDDVLAPDDVPERIAELQANLQNQRLTDYPLISKKKEFAQFRSVLAGFVDAFIQTLHEQETLYNDPSLIENIVVWVHTLSASHIRPFRHTATYISLLMGDTMCDIIKKLSDAAAVAERSIEAAKKQKTPNKGRMQIWKSQMQESVKKGDILLELMKDTFDTVFVHRYRDVDSNIRLECVQSLGYWIETVPVKYYDAEYLRYLGWMLADLEGSIRLETIKRLIAILQIPNRTDGMQKFIEKFRQRFLEMATRDADMSVRVAVLSLLDHLRETGYLEPDDTDAIGRLVFDTDPKLRKAVTKFFVANLIDLYESKVDDLGGVEAVGEMIGAGPDFEPDPSSPQMSWLKLKALVEILVAYEAIDSDPSSHPQSNELSIMRPRTSNSRMFEALQSLYDSLPELQQSEVIRGYLLYDPPSKADSTSEPLKAFEKVCELDAAEESVFLSLLHSSIKIQLLHCERDVKHPERGRKLQTEQLAGELRNRTTRDLALMIPPLLDRFGGEARNATTILRLEHLMHIDSLGSVQEEIELYQSTYSAIAKAFSSHNTSDVIQEACASLMHAHAHDELREIVDEKMAELWEEQLLEFRLIDEEATRHAEKGSYSAMDVAHRTQLRDIVCHLVSLASIGDCIKLFDNPLVRGNAKGDAKAKTPRNMLFSCLASLSSNTIGSDEPESCPDFATLINLSQSLLFYFMWKMHVVQQRVSPSVVGSRSEELVANLSRQFTAFSTVLAVAVRNQEIPERYQVLLANTLMDTFILFAKCRNQTGEQPQVPTRDGSMLADLSSLYRTMPASAQRDILRLHSYLERAYAKCTKRTLAAKPETQDPDAPPAEDDDDRNGHPPGSEDEQSDADSESEVDTARDIVNGQDEDTAAETRKRRKLQRGLLAERALCEFTGKMVFCLVARVLDESVKERLQRNRLRLGPNHKEIVAYLDPPKAKGRRGRKVGTKVVNGVAVKGNVQPGRPGPTVQDEEEGEDAEELELELADDPIVEGDVTDLRRRELLEEDIDDIDDEEIRAGGDDEDQREGRMKEIEDDIMGD